MPIEVNASEDHPNRIEEFYRQDAKVTERRKREEGESNQ
jgi:hypothetical protein